MDGCWDASCSHIESERHSNIGSVADISPWEIRHPLSIWRAFYAARHDSATGTYQACCCVIMGRTCHLRRALKSEHQEKILVGLENPADACLAKKK